MKQLTGPSRGAKPSTRKPLTAVHKGRRGGGRCWGTALPGNPAVVDTPLPFDRHEVSRHVQHLRGAQVAVGAKEDDGPVSAADHVGSRRPHFSERAVGLTGAGCLLPCRTGGRQPFSQGRLRPAPDNLSAVAGKPTRATCTGASRRLPVCPALGRCICAPPARSRHPAHSRDCPPRAPNECGSSPLPWKWPGKTGQPDR